MLVEIVVAAMLQSSTLGAISNLTPLNGSELKALFVGAVVNNSNIKTAGPEIFYADGAYSYEEHGLTSGRYWIEADSICVQTSRRPRPTCRRFGKHPSGDVYLIATDVWGQMTTLEMPVRFIIKPL